MSTKKMGDETAEFFCESYDSGEPPCIGLLRLRLQLNAANERADRAEKERDIARLVRAEIEARCKELELMAQTQASGG